MHAPASTASPAVEGGNRIIRGARIVGEPVTYPAFGDLWMPTWAEDGRLFLTWGDGSGLSDGYPMGYPDYESTDPVTVTECPDETYQPEDEGYFPCWLWCNIFTCGPGVSHPRAALTDAGVLALTGPIPPSDGANASIDVPSGDPFFLAGPGGSLDVSGTNDKPGSLLFHGGRLYFAGHQSEPGGATLGYVAFSDDHGQTWTQVPDSPWGTTSNFRVLMFINMGQNHSLNLDGHAYALGVGTEASWTARTVYLTRVPLDAVTDYDAYEYFIGLGDGAPGWSPDQTKAVPLDGLHTTGQASAMYHEGTGRYLFITTDSGPTPSGIRFGALYDAPQPWGPWAEVATLCFDFPCRDSSDNPIWADGKYIAGLIPKDAGPDHVWFTVAGGDEHYQLQIGRLQLDTVGAGLVRLAGVDRYETASVVALDRFDPAAVHRVYLATGLNFPDALAGGPLAASHGAPILLVTDGGVPEATANALATLAPAEVVALGGTAVIPGSVLTSAAAAAGGARTDRIGGEDRYETAAAIAARLPDAETVYLATGLNFPDALAGGPLAAMVGAPILLTAGTSVPAATSTAIAAIDPDTVVALGGRAVVPDEVLAAAADGAATGRLSGDDRFETAAAIAAQFPGPDTVYVATEVTFPDALAAVPAASAEGAPILLVQSHAVPPATDEALLAMPLRRIVVAGGERAVSDAVAEALGGRLA